MTKSNKNLKKILWMTSFLVVFQICFVNCSQTGFSSATGQNSSSTTSSSGTGTAGSAGGATVSVIGTEANVVPVSIGCGYLNEPCVSVVVCAPGSTTNCVTINNILLDTGSYGLRVFKSNVSSLGLSSMTNSSGNAFAECVSYLDGTSQWGPVKIADVRLGSLTASTVPIQVIDATYPTSSIASSNCENPEASSSDYNGILGVGLYASDCGSGCANTTNNGEYFACTGTACSESAIAINKQVTNPVSLLASSYNNGVILQLPSVSDSGASSVTGYMVLGIGTVTNNTPSLTPSVYLADSYGNFTTVIAGKTLSGFVDSGSNGLFFPQVSSALVDCSGWYCPSSTLTLSATIDGASSSASTAISFRIANADTLDATGNAAFDNLGGALSSYFDWGLPFFFGRTIYVGIEGKSSTYATGPYWLF